MFRIPSERLARAASETKTTPKAARIGRRVSVDIGKLIPVILDQIWWISKKIDILST